VLDVLALALFATGAVAVDTEHMNEGLTAGQTAGTTIQEKYGNQTSLRLNILNPMTSSAAPLETVDGSVAFTGQLSFPSSEKFLEVFMQPGPTGDLATVLVGEDLDFDGAADYSYQVPDPVSGVCGNGIIACTPGTWTDCRYYLWRADNEGRIGLEEGDILKLGGCYCINRDCGNDLVWKNPGVILNDLGGGIVGAIQKAFPGFTVSDVRVSDTHIFFYGQDSSRSSEVGDFTAPSPVELAAYLENPTALTTDATTTAAGQINAQTGLSAQLASLVEEAGTGGQTVNCAITRSIRIDQEQGFCQDIVGDVLVTVRERRFYKMRTGGATYTCRGMLPPDSVLTKALEENPAPYREFSLKDYACNVNHAVSVFNGLTPVPVEVRNGSSGPISATAAIPGNSIYLGRTINYAWFDNDDSGCRKDDVGFYVHDWYEVCTHTSDVATDVFQDSCSILAEDPDCSLREEEVDGVTTYREFNPTGLTPLPSSQTFPGVTDHEITRDWWRKERTYVCQTDGYDFSTVKTRFGTVVESLGEAEATGRYQDQLQGEEGWVSGDGTIEPMDLPERDECETACKTRRPTQDTRAVLTGHSGQLKTNTDSYDILYHTCIDGRCPIEEDEEILKDCQCLNEFAEAASIMQMMRLAGQDTICSDGVAK